MSTESVVEFNFGLNGNLHSMRKETTRGARAIQAFYSITIHSNLVKSEIAIVL